MEVDQFVVTTPETLEEEIAKLALSLSSMDMEEKTRILSAAIQTPVVIVSDDDMAVAGPSASTSN